MLDNIEIAKGEEYERNYYNSMCFSFYPSLDVCEWEVVDKSLKLW